MKGCKPCQLGKLNILPYFKLKMFSLQSQCSKLVIDQVTYSRDISVLDKILHVFILVTN